jgi:hypothetical protein
MIPPRWPPIEMPGIVNVSNRLSSSVVPRPVVIGLTPRWRMPTNAAPISPKTAPEAPPWNSLGCRRSAPAEPPSRAAK